MTTLSADEKKQAYGVIGKNPLRHDGTDKVTGRAQYGADIPARIALGAVAPTPLFLEEAGAFLAGREITAETIQEVGRIAQAAARPISDLCGTAEHRKHLCAVVTRRALEKAIERAKG